MSSYWFTSEDKKFHIIWRWIFLSQHYTEVFISRVECYVGKMNKIFQFSFMSSWKKLANWIYCISIVYSIYPIIFIAKMHIGKIIIINIIGLATLPWSKVCIGMWMNPIPIIRCNISYVCQSNPPKVFTSTT